MFLSSHFETKLLVFFCNSLRKLLFSLHLYKKYDPALVLGGLGINAKLDKHFLQRYVLVN